MATQPTNSGNGIQNTIKGIQQALNQIAQSAQKVFKQIGSYSRELSKLQALNQDRVSKKAIQADLEKIRSSKNSADERRKIELEYFKRLQKKYKENGKKYKEMQKEIDRLNAEGAKKPSFLSGLKEGLGGGAAFGKLLGRINLLAGATAVFRKAQQLLSKALVGSFQAAVDFEAQLAQLQAVTGISNDELSRLEKNVLDVAGSTKFTSEEIVQLQTALGKLGFSVAQIEGATLAVANTAQALGEKVGPVASKIGQILKQYNLDADETTRVSDTLVSVINSSALSFEGFGTALQYIGPLAAEVGTSFEETATAMAILADNGFTASRIGTGLRGILTELSTTGQDLASVLEELAEEEISLSQAVDLVGKRNAAQLITLIDNRMELENLEGKYYEMGAAAIAAAQQVDTFQGNLDLLKSAFNRVQIEFGNFLKTVGLVRVALKLIDEDGYKAALAMEQLANLDPDKFSKALTETAKETVELTRNLGDFDDKSAVYLEKAAELAKSQLLPVQQEYLEIEEELTELRQKNAEAAQGAVQGATMGGNAMMMRSLRAISDEERARLAELEEQYDSLVERGLDVVEINREAFDALSGNIAQQLEDQVTQLRIQEERTKIEVEYEKALKGYTAERNAENIKLNEALKIRAKINTSEKELKDTRDDQQAVLEAAKAELEDIANDTSPILVKNLEDQIKLEQAKLDQLDQELTNLNNVNFSKEELFALAQKEYELEFSTLRNRISERKAQLEADTKILDLRIKTNQQEIDSLAVQIENTTNKEEQKELQEKQNALIKEQTETEAERARLQQDTYTAVQGFVQELNDKLEYQTGLWKNAGFSPEQLRILQQAEQRLTTIGQNIQDLELDLPEAISAADNLAKSLKDRFANSLKDGGMLSETDQEEINKAIADTFKDFNLTPEQQEAISAYIFSSLKPGKKTEDDLKKDAKKLAEFVLGEVADAAEEYNKTALENTTNRLRSELAAIKNRYKTEEDILKSQLDNQLITESQFRAKKEELRKKELQEENEINKKIFEAQKKADLRSVAIETFEAIASNAIKNFGQQRTDVAVVQSALGYAAIVAAGAAKADAIRRRQFFPVKFEEGGLVSGPSHAQGGVPFTVQGQGGYEMEGGEFIVNKKAAAFHRSLLERINGSYKPNTNIQPMQFAQGGLVEAQRAAQINVNANSEESVNYLRAIAEATVSTAINSNKPLRAFVSARDLRSSENERRLKERNDRI